MEHRRVQDPDDRIKRVRDIVGGFGADVVMDCRAPKRGPRGIDFLRDGGTDIKMGEFTGAGSSQRHGTGTVPRTSIFSALGD